MGHVVDENKWKRKGTQIAEDDNSEDDCLELIDSDDEEIKFNFKHFTEADLNDPKFHAGQVFPSVALVRKVVREYSCTEKLNI